MKGKPEEAIGSIAQQHRIFKCRSGWLRCYDCPGMAKPDNRNYWRGKPCSKMRKKQRRGPSAEDLKLWQYVLSHPVEHTDLAADDTSNEGGSEAKVQDPVAYHECEDCLTSNDVASIFRCNTCEKLLCVICGSYGLEDHQCGFCLFEPLLDLQGGIILQHA